ncbi:4'-phosphopantetheinyl transferase superfamily protein [Hymenobacter sp. BT664]|uniref:4'-phosphopantetheinyl transferase superfamily protein n=1 Tax=Hymenobacter montanus TaxID=2771359 RepID=A0A927GIJ1_9BACT|nr:4'-phosphopantetheinyl transferase superfamily protein [Hymenobacter montanus]MBD2767184.1 4'-phosphopantetheinyl transferase superfamily protein [Hymenobacter montanus]
MTTVLYAVVTEPIKESLFNSFYSQMPADLQRKINSFRQWEDRQASLIGRMLLKKALLDNGLSGNLLSQIKYTSFGKPYLSDGPYFNITHSWPYIICAVDQQKAVGIDVEVVREIDIRDFTAQFTASETVALTSAVNPIALFYSLWCKKEAIVKAEGSGLNIPLHELDVLSDRTSYAGAEYFFKPIHIDPSAVCWLTASHPLEQLAIRSINLHALNAE